jgi:hypothetical protein
MEWQYRVVEWHQFYSWDGQAILRDLDQYGSDGWELVTVERPDSSGTPLFIFKRPKGGDQ